MYLLEFINCIFYQLKYFHIIWIISVEFSFCTKCFWFLVYPKINSVIFNKYYTLRWQIFFVCNEKYFYILWNCENSQSYFPHRIILILVCISNTLSVCDAEGFGACVDVVILICNVFYVMLHLCKYCEIYQRGMKHK